MYLDIKDVERKCILMDNNIILLLVSSLKILIIFHS